ncbi:hypothetical protein [Dactylosporangium sp. CA-092794]|uniref:hypothetical protein n=1 Tax=Dactylosporangium sp. CA-092794 TaxID=3239929 RepID=UPI003D943362
MIVRAATGHDRDWIRGVLVASWAETRVVVGGRLRDAAALPALVAGADGRRAGLLTYDTGPAGLEVVTLDATERGRGAGTALLAAARRGRDPQTVTASAPGKRCTSSTAERGSGA